MPVSPSDSITELLVAWSEGRTDALEELVPRIYSDLRRLARAQLRGERVDHTLQPTALVHEAMIRLLDQHSVRWTDRGQFFALAARMMRRVLVDYARYKTREKRGQGAASVPLESGTHPAVDPSPWRILVVDQALHQLDGIDAELVQIVELRFFAGLTLGETARALDLSTRSVQRKWELARGFLEQHLHQRGEPPPSEAAADPRRPRNASAGPRARRAEPAP